MTEPVASGRSSDAHVHPLACVLESRYSMEATRVYRDVIPIRFPW